VFIDHIGIFGVLAVWVVVVMFDVVVGVIVVLVGGKSFGKCGDI
jgi:hypothetical protein